MALVYNLSSPGGRDQEELQFEASLGKMLGRLHLKQINQIDSVCL
jgi:hypothetical protein